MSKTEINDYLSKYDEDLANNVIYRVYGMPGPIFMEKNNDTPTPGPGPEPGPTYGIPFYVENITQEEETLTIAGYVSESGNYLEIPVEYSTDGTTWNTFGTTGEEPLTRTLQPSDKVYLRATTNAWYEHRNDPNIDQGCTIFGVSKVGGNIMSLLYGSNFTGKETAFPTESTGNFCHLFNDMVNEVNTVLVSASELILPATTLAVACYSGMFSGCTSLTTAPSLPATTLAEGCYDSMFSGCTSLTTAPSLPAATLTEGCYGGMFQGCNVLNSIMIFADDISAIDCLAEWVGNVAQTGTFYKLGSAEYEDEFIPEGWTVVEPIKLSQSINIARIILNGLDTNTGYYTINGGSSVSLNEGTTTIPITQSMDGQLLLVHGKIGGVSIEKTMILDWVTQNMIPFYIENTSQQNVSFFVNEERTLEGTMDGINWDVLSEEVTLLPGDKIYLRANSGSNPFYGNTVPKVGGNIMSLIYRDFNGQIEFPDSYSGFSGLFDNNTYLVNISELLLPATTLTQSCYANMFKDCTSLTTAPSLPATTLAPYCYQGMFSGCISLTTAPELPATTLAVACYSVMFSGCTSLTTAPTLPATTLANGCYQDMFRGCTSLTTAPTLPATTLDVFCYQGMFSGCTLLTTAPTLPATTLTNGCYGGMFMGCTSLTTAPAIPANVVDEYCCDAMFRECTSLTTAPTILPATTLVQSCYNEMFKDCTALTTAPSLPATTLTNGCYNEMFLGCTNLNRIQCLATNISASNCTNNWVNGVAATGTFVKAASMTDWTTGNNGIPSGWTVEDATN